MSCVGRRIHVGLKPRRRLLTLFSPLWSDPETSVNTDQPGESKRFRLGRTRLPMRAAPLRAVCVPCRLKRKERLETETRRRGMKEDESAAKEERDPRKQSRMGKGGIAAWRGRRCPTPHQSRSRQWGTFGDSCAMRRLKAIAASFLAPISSMAVCRLSPLARARIPFATLAVPTAAGLFFSGIELVWT